MALDGDGRLAKVTTTAPLGTVRTTTLTWDTDLLVPQIVRSTQGAAATDFLNGPRRALAIRGGQTDAFSHDASGSTLTQGDASDLARAADYDAFGGPLPASATDPLIDEVMGFTSDSSKDHSMLFGYRGEAHLDGIVHLRAREYEPRLGRFSTQDPLEGVPGEVLAANPYPYGANDPLNLMDPLGLSPTDGDFDADTQVAFGPLREMTSALLEADLLRGHARPYDWDLGTYEQQADYWMRVRLATFATVPSDWWNLGFNQKVARLQSYGAAVLADPPCRSSLPGPLGWLGEQICEHPAGAQQLVNALTGVVIAGLTFAGLGAIGGSITITTGGGLALAGGGATVGGIAITINSALAAQGVAAVGSALIVYMATGGSGQGPGTSGGGPEELGDPVDRGNLKKLPQDQIEKLLGESAHSFKRAILGQDAPIKLFDIYHVAGRVYLVEKAGEAIIDTGVRLPGF